MSRARVCTGGEGLRKIRDAEAGKGRKEQSQRHYPARTRASLCTGSHRHSDHRSIPATPRQTRVHFNPPPSLPRVRLNRPQRGDLSSESDSNSSQSFSSNNSSSLVKIRPQTMPIKLNTPQAPNRRLPDCPLRTSLRTRKQAVGDTRAQTYSLAITSFWPRHFEVVHVSFVISR